MSDVGMYGQYKWHWYGEEVSDIYSAERIFLWNRTIQHGIVWTPSENTE